MKNRIIAIILAFAVVLLAGCSANTTSNDTSSDVEMTSSTVVSPSKELAQSEEPEIVDTEPSIDKPDEPDVEPPATLPEEKTTEKTIYTDANGDIAVIPAQFGLHRGGRAEHSAGACYHRTGRQRICMGANYGHAPCGA